MGLLDRWRKRGGSDAGVAASLDRAVVLHESGRLDEAEAIYRDVLARDPRHAEALHLSGVALHQRGEHRAALTAIDTAIGVAPDKALFHFNRGNVHNALGDVHAAAESYATAARLNPGHLASWLNRGRALLQLRDHDRALPALRRAFELDPTVPGLRFQLAEVLIAVGDRAMAVGDRATAVGDRATAAGDRATAAGDRATAAGDRAMAVGDRAAATGTAGKPLHAEAAALLEAHWQEAEDGTGARLMLAHALEQSGSITFAAGHFEAALADAALGRDALLRAHANLGNCYNRLGRMREAAEHYRALYQLDRGNAAAASSWVTCLPYDPEVTPQRLLDAHRECAPHASPQKPFAYDRNQDRRLRIGYLSPDLRRHPVGALLAPVLERRDKDALEVFGYYNFSGADAVTERMRRACDHWRDIAGLDDDAAERLVRADGIDILVDLAGHTTHNRLPLVARKPAPVVAEWLGYYCTTGLPAVDWFITDAWNSPDGQDAWFSEKLHRLPATRFCYEPYEFVPEANALPAAGRGHVTFGSLNNLAKLNERVLSLWGRILAALPQAKLVVQGSALDDEPNRARVAVLAGQCGLPLERVELRGFAPLEQATAAYHGIDIALDPFPFCGGMTSFEALWMGVPVVTLEQPLVHGRQTLGMLHNLALPELVARDADHYLHIAVGLASDLDRLAALRAGLRPRFARSPLMDYSGFARELEGAYRAMWRHHLAGG